MKKLIMMMLGASLLFVMNFYCIAGVPDNVVEFRCSHDLSNKINFEMTDYKISKNGDFQGVTSQWDGDTFKITVKASRNKTKDVAKYFCENAIGGKVLCRTDEGNSPGELNFAVNGIMTIAGNKYKVCVSQGNDGIYNNWWMGSNSDFFGRPRDIISKDGRYVIQAKSDESNVFDVSKVSTPVPPGDWMGELKDTTSLKDISIPGTHDSCTANINTNDLTRDWAVCHDWDLGAKLVLGVRAFDIRVKTTNTDGGRFTIFHGPYYCNRNFNDVLDNCFNFLNVHPSETIILLINSEGNGGECPDRKEEILWKYINEYGKDRFWTKDAIPNLGDVRGKVAIVSRMGKTDADAGIKVTFPDNTKGSTFTNEHGITFFIEDFYKTGNPGAKIDAVTNCFNLLRNGKQHTPAFIYTSCTLVPLITPHDLAEKINPKVHDYFTSLPKGKWTTGWVMMDFVQLDNIIEIVNTNK